MAVEEKNLATSEPSQVDVQAEKSASEIATGLSRAYKNLHFYGENNPVPRETIARLYEVLSAFLEVNETLTYTIAESDLLYRGKPIFTTDDRRESFVFKLFRDGVRALSFHRGINVEEITWLLDALSRAKTDREDADSDVVTQIWERDLAHITYIAVDDYLELEEPDGPQESAESKESPEPSEGASARSRERATEPESEQARPVVSEAEEDGAYGLAKAPEFKLSEKERWEMINLALTGEELDQIGHQVMAEEIGDPRVRVSEIFLSAATCAHLPQMQTDAIRVLHVLCADFLEAGNPAEAARLLSEVKQVLAKGDGLQEEVRVALNKLVETRGTEKELVLLEPRIEEANVQGLIGYEKYLCELYPNSVEPLCSMLGRLKGRRGRDMLCRVLSVLGKQNLGVLTSFLLDSRWYLVRNMIYVMRLMKEPQVVSSLASVATHEDPRVRTEMAHCLAEIGGDESCTLLAKLLDDPEKGVRVLAAKKLGQAGGKTASSVLAECIAKDSFLKRSFDEKCELFDALGRTGMTDVIPLLEKLLKKKSFFRRAETNEMKHCAIVALGRLGTSEAYELLERSVRQTRGSLRKTCLESLRLCTLGNAAHSKGGRHERRG